jgi:hypothetical protein
VKTLLLIFCLAISAFAQGTKSSPNSAPSEKIDAEALIKDILGRAPTKPSEMMGLLKIRAADGSLKEVPIKWITLPFTNQWQDIYQTPEKSIIPRETLIIVHREGMTNHYDYKRAGQPVADVATNPFIPFATSDFWVADFGLEFLHWPNPKHIKTEMKKGRPCYVIETINPHPMKGAYAKVWSWIDTEKGGLIRAQAFSADGNLLKEFEIKNIKRVEGRWQLKAVGIRNEQTDTNTRLEFDLEIKD